MWGVYNGAPFIYPGKNSIGVYITSEICATKFPFSWLPTPNAIVTATAGGAARVLSVSPGAATHAFVLGTNIWTIALLCVGSYYAHHNKFFLSV